MFCFFYAAGFFFKKTRNCPGNLIYYTAYILKNCKLRFLFPNSLNLYILGVRTTKILIRLCSVLQFFYFLCNHFVLVREPNFNLNFYKHNAITRTDNSYNFIKFYKYYFGNYDTLRKGFDHYFYIILVQKRFSHHSKIRLCATKGFF